MVPSRRTSPRLLVLWDVDHTLIETRGVGRAIYERAFPAATGRPLAQLAQVSGRTELDIMAESLRVNGLEPTEQAIFDLAAALARGYEEARDELAATGRALPGASDTLAALAQEPAIHQTVLTGNLRPVARVKLEVFGLDRYLDLDTGAYGDDDHDRSRLVRIAQERATKRTGIAFGNDATVLMGDTRKDIEAGLAAGVRTVGVATGRTSADQLRTAGAHAVVGALDECRKAIERILLEVRDRLPA